MNFTVFIGIEGNPRPEHLLYYICQAMLGFYLFYIGASSE
jgi:hypothetical protein